MNHRGVCCKGVGDIVPQRRVPMYKQEVILKAIKMLQHQQKILYYESFYFFLIGEVADASVIQDGNTYELQVSPTTDEYKISTINQSCRFVMNACIKQKKRTHHNAAHIREYTKSEECNNRRRDTINHIFESSTLLWTAHAEVE